MTHWLLPTVRQAVGIMIMQGGLAAANLGLLDPLWWVITIGSVIYSGGAVSREHDRQSGAGAPK